MRSIGERQFSAWRRGTEIASSALMQPAVLSAEPQSLTPVDMVMLWSCIVVWLVTFLFGTRADRRRAVVR